MLKGPEGKMRYRPLHAHLVARRCRMASMLGTVYAVGPQTGQPPAAALALSSACCQLQHASFCLLPDAARYAFACCQMQHACFCLLPDAVRLLVLVARCSTLAFACCPSQHPCFCLLPVIVLFAWLATNDSALLLDCCEISALSFTVATDSALPSACTLAHAPSDVCMKLSMRSNCVISFCSSTDLGQLHYCMCIRQIWGFAQTNRPTVGYCNYSSLLMTLFH